MERLVRAWLSGGEQKYSAMRGGSWDYDANYTRLANRFGEPPAELVYSIGFRTVR